MNESAKFLKHQDVNNPLFPDSLLQPDRLDLMGKILIVGGSSAGFAGVHYAYTKALELGAGEIKVLLPKCLEKLLPKNPDFIFSGNPKSLGFTKEAEDDLKTLAEWADGILLIGDFGKNSETAQVLGKFIRSCESESPTSEQGESAGLLSCKPIIVTRDAIDLLIDNLPLENPNLRLLLTFTQLQKLLKTVYYPKIITYTMPLPQLADVLHKFTLTYQCGISTFAQDSCIISLNGEVIATSLPSTKYNPLTIWAGEPGVKTLLLTIWSPNPKIAGLAGGIL